MSTVKATGKKPTHEVFAVEDGDSKGFWTKK